MSMADEVQRFFATRETATDADASDFQAETEKALMDSVTKSTEEMALAAAFIGIANAMSSSAQDLGIGPKDHIPPYGPCSLTQGLQAIDLSADAVDTAKAEVASVYDRRLLSRHRRCSFEECQQVEKLIYEFDVCAACKSDAKRFPNKVQKHFYCSEECQKADWNYQHKEFHKEQRRKIRTEMEEEKVGQQHQE